VTLAAILAAGCEAAGDRVRDTSVGPWRSLHKGDADLAGVRVQQFPDCDGEAPAYEGRHPCMIIYVFKDGRAHQTEFLPNGTPRGDFWYTIQPDHWLWEDLDRSYAGGREPTPEDRAKAALAEAARTEFGSAGSLCEDTLAAAKARGVDYVRVVGGCLARDRRAMSLLFWLSAHGGFDAASAEGHSTVVGLVLRRVGDGFFAECLADESPAVRQEVFDDVRYDAGFDAGTEDRVMRGLRRDFPRTFKLLRPR
jgi:hypothetical protein